MIGSAGLWITSAGPGDLRHDAGMVYALDPRIHRVWRSPSTLQFGVDTPILTLDDVSNAEERMLVALDAGVTMPGLQMVARRARADPGAVARLLERIAPVLAPVHAPAAGSAPHDDHRTRPMVVLDGSGQTAARLVEVLGGTGMEVRSGLTWADPVVDVAAASVIVGAFAIEPERHRRWLSRDVPHLAVVFGDDGVRVGPLVRPGAGPCVGCVDRWLADADPAWPAMASQLHTRDPRRETPLVAASTASVAAYAVLDLLSGGNALTGSSVTIAYATGERTAQTWEPHPECGCLAVPAGCADSRSDPQRDAGAGGAISARNRDG